MNKLTLDAPVQGPPAPAGRPPQAEPAQADPVQAEPAAAAQAAAPDQTPDQNRPAQTRPEQTAPEAPGTPPRLSAAVLEQIATALRKGATPLAAQEDLVALHQRIAAMFTTLNEGLGARAEKKAAEDRAALSARIDELEAAVNRMEGALRIEFEPVLKAAVSEALARAAPPPRRSWRGPAAALLLAAAALAAGSYWHGPLQAAAQAAAAALESRTGWQMPPL